jgi:putative ABC transport system permease protein
VIKVAIKGLLGRKLRAALTAFAIVLGVAMVSGTYVLTDTIKHGFDSIFTVAYSTSNAVITGKTAFGGSQVLAPAFSDSLLPRVRALPDVQLAVGAVGGGASGDFAHLVGRDGKVISVGGAPNLGFSVDPAHDRGLNPLVLVQGRWPSSSHDVVIDVATARHKHYAVGNTIGVSARGPTRQFRISGLAELGGVASIGGATLAIFDLPTAQQLFHKVGKFDQIYIVKKPNASTAELVSQIGKILPATTQVRSAAAEAKKQAQDTDKFASILQKFLLAFGFIALFVGSFVIANTLSITIAQRTRELATLRTIGASRRQVLGSVLAEAVVVGVLASVVGLFAGLLLAEGLNALFVSFGIDLPKNGTVFATRTIVVSLLVGTIVTLIASLRPAIRATRVPPIAAVREGATLPPSRLSHYAPLTASLTGALAVVALILGAFGGAGLSGTQRLLLVGVGVLSSFFAVSIIAPKIVKPIAKTISTPAAWAVTALSLITFPRTFVFWLVRRYVFRRDTELPLPWPDRTANDLATRNALRNPARTASAAAALMIGLALVTLVAVLAAGLKQSFEGAVTKQFAADYALTSQNGFIPTDVSSAAAVRKLPQATAVVGVRAGVGKEFGKRIQVTGVDPGGSQVLKLDWKDGSQGTLDSLGSSGALIEADYAKSHHLVVGSPLNVLTPYRRTMHLRVAGIYKTPPGGGPFGTITSSAATFDRFYPQPQNVYALIKVRGGATPANTALLKHAVIAFPDAKIQTEKQFEHSQEAGINILLNLLFVLLGFSIVISLFGIVNTLVLMVFERTRELGMLRAVGMTQLQVRRMIRHESVVTALIGAVLGIPIGIVLALLIGHAIKFGAFAVPYGYLVSFVIAAVVAGIVAAIFPARRASRLNVLEALQYE